MKDLSYRTVPVISLLPPASIDLSATLVCLAPDNKPWWCDGTSWIDLTAGIGSDARLATARLVADVSNNTATLANVTGLAIPLAANSTYAIDARVIFRSAATNTGIRLTQSVPTGSTVLANWSTPTSLTASTLANQRVSDAGSATAGIDTANVNTLASAAMHVITGNSAGNLQIRFGSETAGTNVIIKAGSGLVAHRIE